MREIRGKEVVSGLKGKMEKDLEKLSVVPHLAIIRVGDKPDDIAYERSAKKRMELCGLRCTSYVYSDAITNEEFFREFDQINEDTDIDGILMLRPLPKHLDEKRAEKTMDPAKDVDGISPTNIAKVFAGETDGFAPCTAEAVVETLRYSGEELTGKRAVIIGRSMVVGKPLSMLLLKENCTVTVCHTKTVDMAAICREADVVVACAGRAKMVDDRFLREGAMVMDVGINVDEDGNLCGDVDYDAITEKAGVATPVPGGIGTVTSSVLASHVVRAAVQRRR